MALANDGNTDLAFDTMILREYGERYGQIASELRDMSAKLDSCLAELKSNGWTTPAGTAFHKMAQTNWEENIEKYADLLDTLNEILRNAAKQYEDLVTNHIDKTKIS